MGRNQIQDAIFSAIDTLVNNRIEKIEADKTVLATIVQCTNSLTGEYRVSYNGGSMFAYAIEGQTFITGMSVYVLVPQGDFTQKKTIIGKAQAVDDDLNISFVTSALSSYNLIGKNVIEDPSGIQPIQMCSFIKDNYVLLYQYGVESTSDTPFVTIDMEELTNNIKQSEAILIEASFKNRFNKEHRMGQRGIFGLQFVLAFKDQNNIDEEGNAALKYYSYTIDSNNMTGNPFIFQNWSEQYMIFPIDVENFVRIESIMAFCNDFEDADDLIQAEMWGDDVFVKDIEFYGLREISAVNGDYKMTLSMPYGSTLKSIFHDSSLQVVGKLTKLSDILSDSAMWYWFIEDNRVTSGSDGYQMYGGTGWRYLDNKDNTYLLTLYGDENRAYENNYLCVAVYKETMVLKEQFTIYNEACRRDLKIESSLGINFSFDRGAPTLTCLVDGRAENFEEGAEHPHPDSWFNFLWSKIDPYGNSVVFNQTKDQLQQQYDDMVNSGDFSYSELSAIKNKISELEGVTFELGKNTFTYPVSQIDASATFKCSVYLKDTAESEEYNIGSATITLLNGGVAVEDYSIIIENGDQVFQYSESGVSPDDERYQDPLEVKPLTCHFFDPAGLEVNEKTYEIKWLVPLENTMIETPEEESMVENPSTGIIEWCVSQLYPLAIAPNYDYQALNNQITAIVSYKGKTYTQPTTFLFTKVGENGTNGTDIVAKIVTTSEDGILDKELLALELQDNRDGSSEEKNIPVWNTGQSIDAKVLDFYLYQRNEQINIPNEVSWTMSGGTKTSGSINSKYMDVDNGIVDWTTIDAESRRFRNQIVRATTRLESIDYYAFYSIPVIDYHDTKYNVDKQGYHVGVDPTYTLKSITYNADGHNPLYNKNQGVKIFIEGVDPTTRYVVWEAEGGQPVSPTRTTYEDNPKNASFRLTYEKNTAEGYNRLVPREIENEDGSISYEFLNMVYILPDDTYDGGFCNNLVHCKIYSSKTVAESSGGKPEVDLYIPIYMSLNTYGLKSLNAWDGNHVEINEDENYILAPQVGAGEKDEENKFTGILMGTSKTYDADNSSIGLFGYSHGKQSIFLNAEDGSATFGLPEEQASANNQYTEGRIQLVPGGDSKIGMWTIGSRAMYNISQPPIMRKVGDEIQVQRTWTNPLNPDETVTTWETLADSTTKVVPNDSFSGVNPDLISPPYQDYWGSSQYNVANASISIPYNAQGIVLGANPPYLSIKSMPLNETNCDIRWNGANTRLLKGDSLEVELDPAKSSVFSIYRHTPAINDDGNPVYEDGAQQYMRYPLVGINANGQFYTNAIRDGESTMGIGFVGAFGSNAADSKYLGASFDYIGNVFFKFFIELNRDGSEVETGGKLYLSTGTTTSNEYYRPIGLYGETVTLYAPSAGANTSKTSDHIIEITPTLATIGHTKTGSFIKLPVSGENTQFVANTPLRITAGQSNAAVFEAGDIKIESLTQNINLVSNYQVKASSKNTFNVEAGTSFHLDSTNMTLDDDQTETSLTSRASRTSTDTAYLKLRHTNYSSLYSRSGWEIKSDASGSKGIVISDESANGIRIWAGGENNLQGSYLTLGYSQGGNSDFILQSPHGYVRSAVVDGYNTIQINPFLIVDGPLSVNETITAEGDIKTNSSVFAKVNLEAERDIITWTGEMRAKNFYFVEAPTDKGEITDDLRRMIQWIYDELFKKASAQYLDQIASIAYANQGSIASLQSSVSSLQQQINNINIPDVSNFVTNSRFWSHFHYVNNDSSQKTTGVYEG